MSVRIRRRPRGRRRRLCLGAAAAVPVAAIGSLALAAPAAATPHPHHSQHPVTQAARSAPPAHHLTVGKIRYRKGARGSDPVITVSIGGDRPTSPAPPNNNEPNGVEGVWFRATGVDDPLDTAECRTDTEGTCDIHINPTDLNPQEYTVGPAPVSEHPLPEGWFANRTLGIFDGSVVPEGNPGSLYNTVTTPPLAPGEPAVVPVALNTTDIHSRGDRIAYSRTDIPEPKLCGLRVGMLVDLSSSITVAGVLDEYRRAGQDFVTALQGTPSEVAVHTFGTNSPADSGTVDGVPANNQNVGLRSVATEEQANAVRAHIGQLNVVGAQWTNWDAGLSSFVGQGQHYDVVVVITDGDPTRYGRPDAVGQPTVGTGVNVRTRFVDVENGIFSANAVKAMQGHSVDHPALLAVGVTTEGNRVSPGSENNLRAISGDGDFYTTDFGHLSGVLRSLAIAGCEGKVTVVKHIVPHDGTIDHTTPGGADWEFTSTAPPVDDKTDSTSAVTFDTTGETPTTITAHERTGYTFLHDRTDCHVPGTNVPVVFSQHPDGFTVTPNPDEPITCDVYNRAPAPRPAISIVKTGFPTQYGVAGERIRYTFTVTNTGQTPLRNIEVLDRPFGRIECPRNQLAVGEPMTCYFDHYTTGADVTRGFIHNTVEVTGEDPATGEIVRDDSLFRVNRVTGPHIQLQKVAFPTQYGAIGQVITYTYRVVNTGDVTLHDVTLRDSRLGGITCPFTVLGPGHEMNCTGRHTITAADIAAGRIRNVATVTGHDPVSGRTVSDTDNATVIHHPGPGIQISKEASPIRFTAAGQTINYTYRVANTGNVTLSNISVHDSKAGMVTNCDATTLSPGQETTCRATYVTTAADVGRGYIPNFAYARGVKPDGNSITSAPAEAIVTGLVEVPVTG